MDYQVAVKDNSKPGLTQVLYADYADFSTIAGPVGGSDPEDQVTITADHVFTVETNGWRKMFVNLYKSNAMFEGAGDQFSATGVMKLKAFIPGNKKTVAALIKANPEFLILIQQNPCQAGSYWQMGTKCDAARINPSTVKWASGTFDGKELQGYEFDIESLQDTIYFYEGAVPVPTA